MSTDVDQTSTTVAPDERLAYRGPIQRLFIRPEIGALIGLVGIWVFFWGVADVFGTVPGLANYLDVSAALGIMAVAVALLMIGGEFDLSSGAMTGGTGMLLVLLVKEAGEFGGAGFPLWIAIPITLAFALGVGWLNGNLVEKTALPSFIVTLGTFFVLRGAKLGFAKLFTDKVIVEGLSDAPDHAFWSNIFGSAWLRNDHIWDSFLGGRDLVFAILALLGLTLVALGVTEMSFTPRAGEKNTAGLGIAVVAGLGVFAAVWSLTSTDATSANWLWSAVLGVAAIVAAVGVAMWRYQPSAGQASGFNLNRSAARAAGLGVALVALGNIFGLTLDSQSQTIVGFLLTVQGLRAILFAGLCAMGITALGIAVRRARNSPSAQFALTTLIAVMLAGTAFIVQSEATGRKFRAELFAVLLIFALIALIAGLLRYRYSERNHPDEVADRLGRRLTIGGLTAISAALAIRVLWTTTVESATITGTITYRVSIFYFIAFTVVATWVLLRTQFGSWTFAVGGNKDAARQVGVPAARTKTILFMTVSVAAWLVGMLTAFRLNSVQANVGDGQEFLYIIAAVVGGNLLTGGYGSTVGAAIGALIMAMSFQGIPFAGWNSDWRWLFVGVILLAAVLVNNYVRAKAEAAT